jgi:hypothetical protein
MIARLLKHYGNIIHLIINASYSYPRETSMFTAENW